MLHPGTNQEGDKGSQDGKKSSQKVKKQRPCFCEPSIKQHEKVAQFVRDFMENHSQRGGDSHRKTNQVRRADNRSIDKIVDAISEQIHVADRMDGMARFQGVLMSPEKKLLKDEE